MNQSDKLYLDLFTSYVKKDLERCVQIVQSVVQSFLLCHNDWLQTFVSRMVRDQIYRYELLNELLVLKTLKSNAVKIYEDYDVALHIYQFSNHIKTIFYGPDYYLINGYKVERYNDLWKIKSCYFAELLYAIRWIIGQTNTYGHGDIIKDMFEIEYQIHKVGLSKRIIIRQDC